MPSPLANTPLGRILYTAGVGPDAREARTRRQVNEALQGFGDPEHNYLNDPAGAIQQVMQLDAPTGITMQEHLETRQADKRKTERAERDAQAALMGKYLRGIDPTKDVGAAIDEISPFLTQTLGIPAESLSAFRSAVVANPSLLAALDDKAFEAMTKDNFTDVVVPAGAAVRRGGDTVFRNPVAPQAVTTPAGSVTRVFDRETGRFVTPGAEGSPAGGAPEAPMTVEDLRPHFVAQESDGDYTARNAETGALGAYQVMPETGKALAQRLGLAWRPDMMVKDDPASRRYQDAIGGAAIQEAIDASGGDPATAFSYYYGGSDRSRWGPRTRQYTEDMLSRIGGGGGPVMSSTETFNPKPPAEPKPQKTFRPATKEEIAAAGYPEGTAAQMGSDGRMVDIRTPPAGSATNNPQVKAEAQQALATTLGTMADAFVRLVDLGGVTDPARGPGFNLEAALSRSWLGQTVGSVFGTETQSVREEINNLRPLMIQQVRQATGMSSRAMDSNVELKFYLQAAGDPKKDLLSNLAAIDVLDRTYGTGTALRDALPANIYQRVQQRSAHMLRERPLHGPQRSQGGSVSVGTIARDAQGNRVRFRGGNSADPKNWERVN